MHEECSADFKWFKNQHNAVHTWSSHSWLFGLECSHTKTLWNRVFTLHLAIQIPLNGLSLFSKSYKLNELIYAHWPNLAHPCTIQVVQGSMWILEADVTTPQAPSSPRLDSLELPKGPMTRARSKRFHEVVSALLFKFWKENQLVEDEEARSNSLKKPCTLVQANFSSILAFLARFNSDQLNWAHFSSIELNLATIQLIYFIGWIIKVFY